MIGDILSTYYTIVQFLFSSVKHFFAKKNRSVIGTYKEFDKKRVLEKNQAVRRTKNASDGEGLLSFQPEFVNRIHTI